MRNMLKLSTMVSLILVVVAIPVMAQDEGDVAPQSWLDLILKGGGAIGLIIIGFSVIALALIIEHAINVSRDKLAPPDVIENLEQLLDAQNVQEAYDFCEHNPGYLTNILAAALPKLSHGYESMEQAAHDVEEEESIKLHSKISWLSLIGNVSPLMGLLGTVAGMLDAFGTIERTANPSPSELAGGIKMALVTTMLGLSVAVPATIGFFIFRNRVVKIILEIAAISEDLLDRFRPQGN